MGCGSCGKGSDGKPSGCKSNGSCSSGGCNRMNVHDWLSGIPLAEGLKPFPIIEVSFNQGSRKEFFRNSAFHDLVKGQWIAVEGQSGHDIGQVNLQGELVKMQMKKYSIQDGPAVKKVLRPATDEDMDQYWAQKEKEPEILTRSRAMAKVANLDMKIAEAEMQGDGKKATFYYTADQRVDFRELIRNYATEFKVKVEMRQIGARQESAKVGGIGSCGRELCCSTWLTDFKTVNTAAARYQDLSINQTKLSGQCGRLKCCLNYELDTYLDALKAFPSGADKIETAGGIAVLQKRDIFRNLMWYSFKGSSKQYPLTIERAAEIVKLNKEGIKPEDLKALEVESVIRPKEGAKVVDMGFVNDVGQVSLRALERNTKRNKDRSRQQGQGRGDGRNQNRPDQKAGGGGGGAQQQNRQQPNRPQQPKQQQQGGQRNQGQNPNPANPNTENKQREGGAAGGGGNNPNRRRNRPNRPKGGGGGTGDAGQQSGSAE